MEHRLAEERTPQSNTVEAANQPSPAPSLDRMREARAMERRVGLDDLAIDPVTLSIPRRASDNHLVKRTIKCHGEPTAAQDTH